MEEFHIFPPGASQWAEQVDRLFFALLGIGGFMVLLVALLILWFVVKYRRGADVARAPVRGEWGLEYAWTGVPLLIFLGLFAWAARIYMLQASPPADALEIHAIGRQWMWKFQHPDGQREINQLHLPLGRPVQITLATQDVIHSFYVPAFRIKQDAVPGHITRTWFIPTRAGRYHLFCAEYCGAYHARMRGSVVVMPPADYESWLGRQDVQPSLAQQGEQLFRAHGCSGCHSPASTVHAPSLAGLYGRPVALQSGAVVIADDAYIRDAILLPEKQIAAGYPAIMPSFAGQIDEADLLTLIAYLRSLAEEPASP